MQNARNLLKLSHELIAKDGSKNLIFKYGKSVLESRYVRRSPSYISLYLSSHNGCTMGCRFCWLTQQNLTQFKSSNLDIYHQQVQHLLDKVPEEDNQGLARDQIKVNLNLMARGEPLANPAMVKSYPQFWDKISSEVTGQGYKEAKINLSTIMPYTVRDRDLIDIFHDQPVSLYYSIYSPNQAFRKKWLPNALPYEYSLDKIKKYQDSYHQLTGKWIPLTMHWAVIKGQNDDLGENMYLRDQIREREFKDLKFNLVRYNPPAGLPIEDSQEVSDEKLEEIFKIYQESLDEKGNKGKKGNKENTWDKIKRNPSRIVGRVGQDAFISCGMFPNY